MKHRHFFVILLSILILPGCAQHSSVEITTTDPITGATTTKKYTKFFEGESTLVDGKVELFAVSKINYKTVPKEEQNPNTEEQFVYADLKIHIHNTTPQRFDFLINSVQVERHGEKYFLLNEPRAYTLIPNTVERFLKHDYVVGNMDEDITIIISYTWKGKKII